MTAELQTRTEHSRSMEDAEKFRALNVLKEVGLLIPLTDVETYHGRVRLDDHQGEWAVDPTFANGSNDSGNNNVNNRPTLYTGEEQVAEDFAIERGTAIIRRKYNQIFEERVRNYTAEQRQEWLDRINQKQQDWWRKLAPDTRKYYPAGPKVYTLDDFNKNPGGWMRDEAQRLRDITPQEEKKALWEHATEGLRAEVHEIVTADTDATILNIAFKEAELDDEARTKYRNALKTLALPMTEGSPVGFNDRDNVEPVVAAMQKLNKSLILNDDIESLAADAGVEVSVVLQLASAFNTRQMMLLSPPYLVKQLITHPTDIYVDRLETKEGTQDVPMNLEYVQRFLREAHIVSVKQAISSATLNRSISSISFIDLERIHTASALESQRQAVWQRLGGLATSFSHREDVGEVQSNPPLLRLLEDVYVKPNKLVAAAMEVEGYREIFNADAGNWEGFTLAEHTETVLRNFDESFADDMPVELLAPMRLAILSHDVGKPIAVARGEKHRQLDYNVAQANDFLGKLGVDDRTKGLLIAMIGKGEALAFRMDIKGEGGAQAEMREFAVRTLREFNSSNTITNEQIDSFIEMCRILQVCDGGAYTSMAVTHKQNGRGRYRNAPSFNSSFTQPVDLGKRTLRLRKKGISPAALNQTPKSNR